MDNPVTELDARFSDPGVQPTAWEETQGVLENAQLTWLTTVRADGRPHVTPLVAVWLEGRCTSAPAPRSRRPSTWRPTRTWC
ncbi:pyridoxamine 5'-phosphate oxidase family protein [Promicromonospora sp. NPDC019610]|uniref:pyridoxamine 5'-phosphate oxidase family protein n=1 Tax=Promicromonospora sp. NPDC019610 TaxID=3364405 RepID=UPI0037BABDC7